MYNIFHNHHRKYNNDNNFLKYHTNTYSVFPYNISQHPYISPNLPRDYYNNYNRNLYHSNNQTTFNNLNNLNHYSNIIPSNYCTPPPLQTLPKSSQYHTTYHISYNHK